MKPADTLFIGWFGPPRLIFAVQALYEKVPDNDTITLVGRWTVILLSVVAHGGDRQPFGPEGWRHARRRTRRTVFAPPVEVVEKSRMRSEPLYYEGGSPAVEPIGKAGGRARRIGARLLHEAREALPPTIFFFLGFNFIVLTSNLLVARYVIGLSNFMLATMAALVVGKAVLLANKIPLFRRYDRAPLIQPILFKTGFYWVIVFFVRLLERFVHFLLEGNAPGDFGSYLITTFSWHRFLAISLWLFVLFLIYVTVSEFSHFFGSGEIPRLLFTRRPSELQLNRRQRMRELLRLSRFADAHSRDELSDPTNPAHRELIDIMQRLAR